MSDLHVAHYPRAVLLTNDIPYKWRTVPNTRLKFVRARHLEIITMPPA